jgi:hypothetical protein
MYDHNMRWAASGEVTCQCCGWMLQHPCEGFLESAIVATRAQQLWSLFMMTSHRLLPTEQRFHLATVTQRGTSCRMHNYRSRMPEQASVQYAWNNCFRTRTMGPLEFFLHDPVADDEFCSFVEALACPDNVRSVSEAAGESAAPVAQLTAQKCASYEEKSAARHSHAFRTAGSTQQGISAQQTIARGSNGESMETTISHQHDLYLNRLEKARERNRRNQRACRDRVRVRCHFDKLPMLAYCLAYVSQHWKR